MSVGREWKVGGERNGLAQSVELNRLCGWKGQIGWPDRWREKIEGVSEGDIKQTTEWKLDLKGEVEEARSS